MGRVRFCAGSPTCLYCKAPHNEGDIQNCPNKRSPKDVDIKSNETRRELNIVKKTWSYSKAVFNWVKNGSPQRSQEEIELIFDICKQCERYSDIKHPHCKECGCIVSSTSNSLNNKIAMATENCPLGKW